VSDSGRRIGYVLKRFPRISETFVAAELLELRRQGEDVTVFALSRPQEPFTHRFLAELDVPVVYLPHRPLQEPVRVARALAEAWRHPLRWLRALAAVSPPSLRGWRRLLQATVLARELRLAGIDHVHAHFASTAARLAHLTWRMGGPNYSVTAHAKDIYHHEVRADQLAATLGAAMFVATVSEANVRHLRQVLEQATPVELVPNSVDVERIAAAAWNGREATKVLTVARLVEKKGIEDLVQACGLLRAAGTAVQLDVVGDGPLRAQLEAVAEACGAEVRFLGALDHDDVLALYATAAVFALPCVVAPTGDRDGLPTAVLEAMASGLPVVATGVNGLVEAVIDGVTGLVVPEHDPAAVAAAIGQVLADPALARRLGDAGRVRAVERFSLRASAARLRQLFPAGGVAA
jgi:glycosyltransferase involved in cell wall biosynthesis